MTYSFLLFCKWFTAVEHETRLKKLIYVNQRHVHCTIHVTVIQNILYRLPCILRSTYNPISQSQALSFVVCFKIDVFSSPVSYVITWRFTPSYEKSWVRPWNVKQDRLNVTQLDLGPTVLFLTRPSPLRNELVVNNSTSFKLSTLRNESNSKLFASG